MGYTHYWYRPLVVPKPIMQAIVADFTKLLPTFEELGIKLADWQGRGKPEASLKCVWFNGAENCGHPKNSCIVIPWPTTDAHGIGTSEEAESGNWFAGTTLNTRCCDGDCSYETFMFARDISKEEFLQPSDEHKGLYFACCKTAFRPACCWIFKL